jgi:hypothetical protein
MRDEKMDVWKLLHGGLLCSLRLLHFGFFIAVPDY